MQRQFLVGDPIPDFHCATTINPNFSFGSVAGRYIVLCFYGSTQLEQSRKAIECITTKLRPMFNDSKLCFFGVCTDPEDQEQSRVANAIPGIRYFWDFDHKVSKLYGALNDENINTDGGVAHQPFTLIIDPSMRVLGHISLHDPEQHNQTLERILSKLPPVDEHAGVQVPAPVLVIPRVFEPDFCRKLIELYEAHGSYESGSMIDRDGKTIGKVDYNYKRRMDCNIDDEAIQEGIRNRVNKRIIPEIYKAFQFRVTRIERFIVACYEGEHGGFFARTATTPPRALCIDGLPAPLT